MAYTKTIWDGSTPLNLVNLQHMDGQYAEVITDLAAHVTAGHPAVYRPQSDMDSYFWHAGNDGAASGLDADTLEGYHASEISGGAPSGIMVWWYPENGAVPSGFLFADGDNGTYDMRSRFPVGASSTIGATVGNSSVKAMGSISVGSHALTIPQSFHNHAIANGIGIATGIGTSISNATYCANYTSGTANTGYAGSGNAHTHTGTFAGDAKSLDPVFTYLVIIQKS